MLAFCWKPSRPNNTKSFPAWRSELSCIDSTDSRELWFLNTRPHFSRLQAYPNHFSVIIKSWSSVIIKRWITAVFPERSKTQNWNNAKRKECKVENLNRSFEITIGHCQGHDDTGEDGNESGGAQLCSDQIVWVISIDLTSKMKLDIKLDVHWPARSGLLRDLRQDAQIIKG